jgi:hypothetical protein
VASPYYDNAGLSVCENVEFPSKRKFVAIANTPWSKSRKLCESGLAHRETIIFPETGLLQNSIFQYFPVNKFLKKISARGG